jgi:hypothetical protein
MLRKFYYYLFAHLYNMFFEAQKENTWFIVCLILSVSLFAYLLAILALLAKFDIVHLFPQKDSYGIVLLFFISVIHYFIFRRNKKYQIIINDYSNESSNKSDFGNLISILYYILAVLSVIMVACFRKGML